MRSNVLPQRKPGSALALAIALACGTAVAAVGFAEPAYAQKKKKKKGEDAQYSKEFIEAYNPLNTAMNEGGADIPALRPQIDALLAIATSGDEKLASGNLAYNAGAQSNDRALQLAGMESMLASGKLTIENQPQYNFVAYQLANALGDQNKARNYLQQAINLNYTNDQITPDAMQAEMAESYFREDRFVEGLNYLKDAIASREASGSAAPEQWYRRGLQIGYSNDIQPQVYDFVVGWVENYPSEVNWRDAVNIARNLNTYQSAEMLDLMRLAFKLDTMNNKQDYIEYVEAADARRLPKEVADVIEQGYSTGRVSRDDIYLADALTMAKSRIASDSAELPALERDARSASAGLRTVVAAGDAFLNYSEYAKAEEFYAKALNMPGVETAEVTTRLGIAQAKQGKNAEAAATFASVEGARKPIAMLWGVHAAQAAAPTVAAPATAAPEAEPATGG